MWPSVELFKSQITAWKYNSGNYETLPWFIAKSRSILHWTYIWRDGLVPIQASALQKSLFRVEKIILAKKSFLPGFETRDYDYNYCKRRSSWWSCNRLGIWWSAATCDGVGSSPAIKFACLRCINLEVQLHAGRDRPWFTCSRTTRPLFSYHRLTLAYTEVTDDSNNYLKNCHCQSARSFSLKTAQTYCDQWKKRETFLFVIIINRRQDKSLFE